MTHISGCSCDGPARAQADGFTARDVWDGPALAGPCSALPCGTLSLSLSRVRVPLARLALAPPGPHARGVSLAGPHGAREGRSNRPGWPGWAGFRSAGTWRVITSSDSGIAGGFPGNSTCGNGWHSTSQPRSSTRQHASEGASLLRLDA